MEDVGLQTSFIPCVVKSTLHTVSSNQKHIPVLSYEECLVLLEGTCRVCSSHHQSRGQRSDVLPLKESAVKTQNWMVEPNTGTREKVALWHSRAHSEDHLLGRAKGKGSSSLEHLLGRKVGNQRQCLPLSFFYLMLLPLMPQKNGRSISLHLHFCQRKARPAWQPGAISIGNTNWGFPDRKHPKKGRYAQCRAYQWRLLCFTASATAAKLREEQN